MLELAAAGLTTAETAARLKVQYTTVQTHRKEAILRLRAKNMTHAVWLYAQSGGRPNRNYWGTYRARCEEAGRWPQTGPP